MTDVVDKQTRSRMMAGIRGSNTKPELDLRRAIHAKGLRYRLHVAGLPGKPDLVFARHRTAVFVHGCFWHRHEGCRYKTNPATRPDFWERKFAGNIARDQAAMKALAASGWRIAVIWECALRRSGAAADVAEVLSSWIMGGEAFLEIGQPISHRRIS